MSKLSFTATYGKHWHTPKSNLKLYRELVQRDVKYFQIYCTTWLQVLLVQKYIKV